MSEKAKTEKGTGMEKLAKKYRAKGLYVIMTDEERVSIKLESALTGKTIKEIVRNRLLDPLREKHRLLIR